MMATRLTSLSCWMSRSPSAAQFRPGSSTSSKPSRPRRGKRNDRIITVGEACHEHSNLPSLNDLTENLVNESGRVHNCIKELRRESRWPDAAVSTPVPLPFPPHRQLTSTGGVYMWWPRLRPKELRG